MIVVHLYLSVSHANRTKIVDAVRSVHGPISVQPGCRKFSLFCDVDNDDPGYNNWHICIVDGIGR